MLSKILVIITSLIFAIPVVAQDSKPQVWNWGWNSNTRELFAYSENADSNLLLADVTEPLDAFWRLSEARAIGLIRVADQLMLYTLDSQSARKLSTSIDSQNLEPFVSRRNGLGLEVYHYPYMVFAAWGPVDKKNARPAFLVNLDTNTVEYLSDSVDLHFCCRFTQDGHSLRYVITEGDLGSETMTLRERSLNTGSERILFKLSGALIGMESDNNGERWLISEQENDLTIDPYRIFEVRTGTDKLIFKPDPSKPYTDYSFVGNNLISYQPLCETHCILQLQTADNNMYSYPLPDTHGGAGIYSFYRTVDNRLIIGRLSDYWLLSIDIAPKFMGYIYADGVGPTSNSSDGRFVVISDTENYPQMRRMIIDWANLKILTTLTDNPETIFDVIYNQQGFIINSIDNDMAMMYLFSTDKTIILSKELHRKYFEILPDDSVLFTTTSTTNPQIFRYFSSNNRTMLLAEGLSIIPTIDVANYTYS